MSYRPLASRCLPLLLALGGLVAAAASASAQPPFERPDRVPAASYLEPALLAGDGWTVATEASSDGFANVYTLESRFGRWTARGRFELGNRIREVEALAELERISKSDVFVDAVKRSAVGQVETITSFATRPVETVSAIPGAAKRWFQKSKFQASETYQNAKEAAADGSGSTSSGVSSGDGADRAEELAKSEALDYLKITGAERRWYAELGVDPYTDNEVLRRAVKSYARIEGLTSFGMKFVGLPSIPGIGALRRTMDLVWNTDPWELRLRNRKILIAAGVGEETARRFEDHPSLSLTQQTALVDLLQALGGVAGREHLLARALDVESRGEAQSLVAASALLLRFHQVQAPLVALLAGSRLPVARTRSGELAAVTPTDALFWTEGVAEAANGFAELYAGERSSARRLWVVGEASPRFESEASKLGWEVRDRWQLSAPEDQTAAAPSARP